VGRRSFNGLSRTSALLFGACDAALFSAVALLFEQFCPPPASRKGSRKVITTAGILAQCVETPQQSRRIKPNPLDEPGGVKGGANFAVPNQNLYGIGVK
jgi:hypothetical protein